MRADAAPGREDASDQDFWNLSFVPPPRKTWKLVRVTFENGLTVEEPEGWTSRKTHGSVLLDELLTLFLKVRDVVLADGSLRAARWPLARCYALPLIATAVFALAAITAASSASSGCPAEQAEERARVRGLSRTKSTICVYIQYRGRARS